MKGKSWQVPAPLPGGLHVRLGDYVDCEFWDGLERASKDTRDDPLGHALVFATLIAKKFLKGYESLELQVSVVNLFDKDFKNSMDLELPNDLQWVGRNYMLEMKYTF